MNTHRRFAITALLMAAGALSTHARAELPNNSRSEISALQADSKAIDQIAAQLSGTWKTTEPFESLQLEDGQTESVYMMMSVAPITLDGMDNVMYVESVRSNAPWDPFRQSVFQLYEYKGKVRLRTYTMAVDQDTLGMLIGMNAVPDQFVGITSENLIPTLDVELDVSSKGFSGSTPYPYPTSALGAVEMTSEVSFDGKALTTTDRGYDAQGQIVWGGDADSTYTFEKSAPYTSVTNHDNGLIVIDYPSSISETIVQDGDKMHMHYSGYLTNGMKFDASYDRGSPYAFIYPPGTGAIEGWGNGMDGLTLGAHRKLIIPSELGYKVNGNPRARIPGDSTLVFNVFLAHLERAEPAPEADGAQDNAGQETDEHDHTDHTGHSHD